MFKEFKEFAMRGNVLDMAVGIIIGAAFGAIVTSLVADVIMPPIGLLLGSVDFSNLFVIIKQGSTPAPYDSLTAAKDAGAVTINYGIFILSVISFLIVASVVFMLVRSVNRLKREDAVAAEEAEPDARECPFCFTSISAKARRCPNCTSQLDGAA
ncbi:MAG TPA: large-conductance mechanosensitive channel protein MscL [Thermoleophilia bacterium]|nr:large-conductance mechanosensitive channel protein MscL [Thermoleophilia bacterium]